MSFLTIAWMALKGVGGFFLGVYKGFGIAGLATVALLMTNLGTVGYYEGVPLLRHVWFIGDLPAVGPFIIGHVQTRVNEAVAGARHGFAVEQENAAAKATADAETQSKLQAQKVAAVYNSLLTEEQAKADQTSKELNNELAKAADTRRAAGDPCGSLDDAHAVILHKLGFKILKR